MHASATDSKNKLCQKLSMLAWSYHENKRKTIETATIKKQTLMFYQGYSLGFM